MRACWSATPMTLAYHTHAMQGVVTSTTLMVPCPRALHAPGAPGESLRDTPGDVPLYRRGPLAVRESVPSLLDEAGFFYSNERIPALLTRASLSDVEREFRAQIEIVLAASLTLTYLDWTGSACTTVGRQISSR